MPWSQPSPMDQRTQFIADYLRQSLSVKFQRSLNGVRIRLLGHSFYNLVCGSPRYNHAMNTSGHVMNRMRCRSTAR
jgi:hypothetical protein